MISVESVVVRSDRIIAVVRMDDDAPRHTSQKMMDCVLERFPDLPWHSCINSQGPRFGDVMDCTSIPHLLEHLVVDLQASAYTAHVRQEGIGIERQEDANRNGKDASARQGQSKPPLLKGVTKWVDREAGVAQVQFSYFDDVIALAALTNAVAYLNAL